MRSRAAAVLLALALVAAACGGGDDGDGGNASDTTAAGSATTTAAPGAGGEGGEGSGGGDGASTTTAPGGTATTAAGGGGGASTTTSPGSAALGDAVLRQGDFPGGWTSEPAGDQGDDEALERCLGLPPGGDRPEARSPDFTVSDAITQASSAVELAPDVASADREFAAVTGPRFLDCAAKQFDAFVARESPGAQFGPSRAERIPFPERGEGTAAVRITVTLSAAGQQVPFFADLVFVRKGLLELTFRFVNAGQPFDAGLAADLVAKVVARA